VTSFQINNVIKAQTSRVNETISSGPFHKNLCIEFLLTCWHGTVRLFFVFFCFYINFTAGCVVFLNCHVICSLKGLGHKDLKGYKTKSVPSQLLNICKWFLKNLEKKTDPDSVLLIHDIFVRIRIRGSMPLTSGSGFGSGSFFFIINLQDANKKQFFKDKKSKRSHKTVKIKVFLTIFA
jgi:hypothetical protein